MKERRPQKNLILIIAREFASKVATPMLITDARGRLVYFNEPAESVLGQAYAEAGELPAEEWQSLFRVEDADGRPLELGQMPAGVALIEGRPAHASFCIYGFDGARRTIEVSAFPLFAREDELVGVVAIFWEPVASSEG